MVETFTVTETWYLVPPPESRINWHQKDAQIQVKNLGHAKRKTQVNITQKEREKVENSLIVSCILRTEEERDCCYQHSSQKPSSMMVCEYISFNGLGIWHVWTGNISAQSSIKVLEQHMLPSFWEGLAYFSKTMENSILHTASISKSWLHRKRACTELSCLQSKPIENIWCIMKQEVQEDPGLLSSFSPISIYIRQQWDNIPLPNYITRSPQFPAVYGFSFFLWWHISSV